MRTECRIWIKNFAALCPIKEKLYAEESDSLLIPRRARLKGIVLFETARHEAEDAFFYAVFICLRDNRHAFFSLTELTIWQPCVYMPITALQLAP